MNVTISQVLCQKKIPLIISGIATNISHSCLDSYEKFTSFNLSDKNDSITVMIFNQHTDINEKNEVIVEGYRSDRGVYPVFIAKKIFKSV